MTYIPESFVTIGQLAESEPWHGFSRTSNWTSPSQLVDRTVRIKPNKGLNKENEHRPIDKKLFAVKTNGGAALCLAKGSEFALVVLTFTHLVHNWQSLSIVI